ncbi:hypothetical protein [Streptomyces longispororuber]|uniref:hypothetical protein n=1 Tax=Streptomyces longispororuber TaxID=68230 RepID=UPI00210C29F8|nr:hypothetical protein [Streptomyces longispororuber]MCQ4206677.1 hypothetical protein [Streptomyces longispororuber]
MTTETVVGTADRTAGETADTAQRAVGRPQLLVPAVITAGVVAVALGAWADLWFLPFAAGLATGAVTAWHRTGRLRTTALLVLFGPVSWAALLVVRALAGDTIGGTARTTAGLAGLPASAAVTIALTLVVALLQTAAGNWSGRALFRCFAGKAAR